MTVPVSASGGPISDEGAAISYSLRELLGQPEIADTVDLLRAELSRLRAVLTQQEEALTRIRENAESWHGLGEDGPRKALAVIAGWCSDALTGVRSDG